jgi:hypothetical protein
MPASSHNVGMASHAARIRRWPIAVVAVVVAIVIVVVVLLIGSSSPPHHSDSAPHHHPSAAVTASTPIFTTTTSSTLPAPAAGFQAGHVTAVGDSVMLDYQNPLQTDIPGINVNAAVSRQWDAGQTLLQQLKAQGQLGAEVIVALGTNGPVTTSDFDSMMNILQGASRIVFVNVHVDRPWQDPNNAVLTVGANQYPHVVIANWASLAAQNPQWFGPDGTHLAIDGPGADALASLIATTLSEG